MYSSLKYMKVFRSQKAIVTTQSVWPSMTPITAAHRFYKVRLRVIDRERIDKEDRISGVILSWFSIPNDLTSS